MTNPPSRITSKFPFLFGNRNEIFLSSAPSQLPIFLTCRTMLASFMRRPRFSPRLTSVDAAAWNSTSEISNFVLLSFASLFFTILRLNWRALSAPLRCMFSCGALFCASFSLAARISARMVRPSERSLEPTSCFFPATRACGV